MKKVLLASLLVLFGLAFSVTTTAQEKTDAETSHWSVGVKAGLNYYRVEPGPDASVTGRINRVLNAVGWTAPVVTIEYSFNPLFGVGVDAGYYTFNRSGAAGNTIDLTGFGSINMTNLLLKERTGFWNRVNFYTNMGIGVNRSSYTITSPSRTGTGLSLVVPTTLLLELRLTDKISLGAEAQYRYYMNEALGGRAVQGMGTDAMLASGSLRYKLGGKSKTHVRNMTIAEYYPAPVPVIIEKIVEKAVISEAELNRFKKLEEGQAELNKKLAEVKDATAIIEERSALNAAETRRIQALESMNALLLAEVGKIKDLERNTTTLQAEVIQLKAATAAPVSSTELKKLENEVADLRDRLNAALAGVAGTVTPGPSVDLKKIQESNDQLKAQIECLKKAIEESKKDDLEAEKKRIDAVEKDLVKIKELLVEMKEKKEEKKEAKVSEVDLNAIAGSVKFRFNSTQLDPESNATLDKLVDMMKAAPTMKIRVSGHSDNIGSVDANKRLSLQRANSVKAYLVSKGVAAANVSTVGVGPDKPIDTNDTAEGRARNRRVEFEVIN